MGVALHLCTAHSPCRSLSSCVYRPTELPLSSLISTPLVSPLRLPCRFERVTSRDHDSKRSTSCHEHEHWKTQKGKLQPPRVEAELATLAPGYLRRDIISWNKRLARYVKAGHFEKTLELFKQMENEGMNPTTFSFVPVLKACATLGALKEGNRIHSRTIQIGCELDVYVSSSLVDMYAKCGSIEDAWKVFNKMPMRDVVAWTSMIVGCVRCGQGQKALELSQQMQREGVKPNPITFVGVLSACASVVAIEEGRHAHEQIIQMGYESCKFIGSCLIDMYAKCGSIDDAERVFNSMPRRDVVAWTAMILGHVKCGQGQRALELSRRMQQEWVKPNAVTFVGMLNACASLGALEEGRSFHEQICQSGFESDVYVSNSLINMYTKCECIEDAWRVFNKMRKPDVATWSTMITGFVKCDEGQKALDLWWQMQRAGVHPNSGTFVAVLKACASVARLEEGRNIHAEIIQCGFEVDVYVVSSLVDMYTKCGSIDDAWSVFNQMPVRTVVSWNAMILGYVKCGQGRKALGLYQQMEGVEPDSVTFTGVLNACASIAVLEEGRRVHDQIVLRGYESDVFLSSCLIDMYAKCGSIEDARKVFNNMPTFDVVSWNAMLGGYAMHGRAKEAVDHFKRMWEEGVKVNGVTFISLLSTCGHTGLVDEGLHYFESMTSVFNVPVTAEHYTCVVNLLGRAGRLLEAEDLIDVMSCEPDGTLWMSLLGSCKFHENVEMGERIAKKFLKLDPICAAGYL